MTKRAFLFAGQGAQKLGMASDLYAAYPVVKETFDAASRILGYDLRELIDSNEEKLNQTRYTQPAILTTSVAIYRLLAENGITPDIVAGLSLGEYSALVAAGALSFEDAVALVAKRGEFMETAAPAGSGKMVAVMNTDPSLIEEICQQASEKGVVTPANYNTPAQIVIGGEVAAVDYAVELLKEAGAKRLIPLNVSGPFHTALLESASQKLAAELEKVSFNDFDLPLVGNTEATIMKSEDVKALLARQVKEPVRFYDSIATIQEFGVDEVIEIGPGKVLSGFLKKIDKTLPTHNVEDQASLDALLNAKNEVKMELKNKNVFVTGSTRGIGLAVAHKFASLGANVVLNGRSEISEDLLAQFADYGVTVVGISGDISNGEDAQRMVAEAIEKLGSVDVLVNNAGITNDKLMLKMTEEDFERVLKINLTGAFNMTQAVLKPMSKARQGAIINMSSVVGLMGNIGQANYAASKAGLIGFTKSVAREVAARGVRVNAIAPGFIESDMTDAIPEKMKDAMLAQVPMKRIGQAEEVAEVAAFLAGQEYLTGQTIAIDGGMTMQ